MSAAFIIVPVVFSSVVIFIIILQIFCHRHQGTGFSGGIGSNSGANPFNAIESGINHGGEESYIIGNYFGSTGGDYWADVGGGFGGGGDFGGSLGGGGGGGSGGGGCSDSSGNAGGGGSSI